MAVVLGIDAAWTAHNPSGVALVIKDKSGWRCAGASPSYSSFVALSEGVPVDWSARQLGGEPDLNAVLTAATALAGGQRPDVVAVDMPLATTPITGRRPADSMTSRAFGPFKCAVHSPTPARPGPIATYFVSALADAGYPLATTSHMPGRVPAALEVYPHAAIVRLMKLTERLKYKVARTRKLWPGATVTSRIANVIASFHVLRDALENEFGTILLTLPEAQSVKTLTGLKSIEDSLDALVCALVGARYLTGNVEALGDETAAIWVPTAD